MDDCQGHEADERIPTSYHRIVEYSTPEEAQRAIKELSDTPLLGRPVFIREVRSLAYTKRCVYRS